MDTSTQATAPVTMVIPCGGAKLDRPAAARDLYTGQMFRHTLAAAQAEADAIGGRVLILSAEHGLITLDTVIAPYDRKMGQAGSVTPDTIAAQALALGIDWGASVYALLPAAYYRPLDEALRAQDVYEATAGIGDQRHVNAIVNPGGLQLAPRQAQPVPGQALRRQGDRTRHRRAGHPPRCPGGGRQGVVRGPHRQVTQPHRPTRPRKDTQMSTLTTRTERR